MELFYDFDFIDQKRDLFLGDFELKLSDVTLFMQTIEKSIAAMHASPYAACFDQVFIILKDSPAEPNEYAYTYAGKLYIQLNVLTTILDYYRDPFYRRLIFSKQKGQVSLEAYIQFFFFHECGHIVHSQLSSPNIADPAAKFESYLAKYIPFNRSFDLKYRENPQQGIRTKAYLLKTEKAYRKLPHERYADQFAFSFLSG